MFSITLFSSFLMAKNDNPKLYKSKRYKQSRYRHQGFTLIELLVAVVVLAIGLLGMVGLQTTGLHTNQSAYYRSQATIAIADIAERMRANRQGVADSFYDDINSEGTSPSASQCIGSDLGCNPEQLAQHDTYEWLGQFKKTPGDDANFTPVLPGATATVSRINGTNTFTVTIGWVETDWDQAGDKTTNSPADIGKASVQKQLSIPIEIL